MRVLRDIGLANRPVTAHDHLYFGMLAGIVSAFVMNAIGNIFVSLAAGLAVIVASRLIWEAVRAPDLLEAVTKGWKDGPLVIIAGHGKVLVEKMKERA